MRNKNPIKQGSTRKAVLEYISDHPGSSLMEISTGIGISRTPVAYHVRILAEQGAVVYTPGKHRSLKVV